eukprot:TRINITY_DN4207_c0_g1_i29.p2 TRINITY_DN4207_c0_g1~~TRINITY_DN4207_c0_g1_i29.p2  ORF type:complete len:105 (+),score=28.04 TRINITY_DN4207_c0_g1_i29:524-838(+)
METGRAKNENIDELIKVTTEVSEVGSSGINAEYGEDFIIMEKQLAASTMKDPVNIPRRVKDAYYRYQMPKLTVESQGKNQATVTIITNLDAVASALATRTECKH